MDAPIYAQNKPKQGKWKKRTTYSIRTIRHPVFTNIHKLTYHNGKKLVTREWLDKLDERGLAVWFFDDGNTAAEFNKYSTGRFYFRRGKITASEEIKILFLPQL